MGIFVVVGCLLIALVGLVLIDGVLHRAMEDPEEHHPVSSVPEATETAVKTRTDLPDRV